MAQAQARICVKGRTNYIAARQPIAQCQQDTPLSNNICTAITGSSWKADKDV